MNLSENFKKRLIHATGCDTLEVVIKTVLNSYIITFTVEISGIAYKRDLKLWTYEVATSKLNYDKVLVQQACSFYNRAQEVDELREKETYI